jgi:signal transduction histidine kinase
VVDAYESARRALAEVRSAVQVVRADDRFDLPKALRQLADDSAASLTVEGTATGSAQVLTTLFRAAQESVTNAKRHANASAVQMRLTFTGKGARLDVTDDGRGFDPRSGIDGFGLRGMRERAELVGGRLEVHSEPGTGTRVTVTVPT